MNIRKSGKLQKSKHVLYVYWAHVPYGPEGYTRVFYILGPGDRGCLGNVPCCNLFAGDSWRMLQDVPCNKVILLRHSVQMRMLGILKVTGS